VLDSVVTPGETIELRAQGIDQAVKVRIDGRRVKARVLDEQTVSVTLRSGSPRARTTSRCGSARTWRRRFRERSWS
jgi:hypothetical protein